MYVLVPNLLWYALICRNMHRTRQSTRQGILRNEEANKIKMGWDGMGWDTWLADWWTKIAFTLLVKKYLGYSKSSIFFVVEAHTHMQAHREWLTPPMFQCDVFNRPSHTFNTSWPLIDTWKSPCQPIPPNPTHSITPNPDKHQDIPNQFEPPSIVYSFGYLIPPPYLMDIMSVH
jgi:hypothetical protein